MPSTTDVQSTNTHTKIRLLLTLWDLGGAQKEVPTGQLTKRIVPKGSKKADFQALFDELQAEGAIEIAKKGYSMPELGVQVLNDSLKSPDFRFGSQVGAKTANALLKWIREGGTLGDRVSVVAAAGKGVESAIASYDEFKPEALALFEKLDKSYNYSGLVPIWHLRQEIGERVSREDFNDWMMQMQREQFLDLQTGEAPGTSEDQKRDSITSEIRGILFFASKAS